MTDAVARLRMFKDGAMSATGHVCRKTQLGLSVIFMSSRPAKTGFVRGFTQLALTEE